MCEAYLEKNKKSKFMEEQNAWSDTVTKIGSQK